MSSAEPRTEEGAQAAQQPQQAQQAQQAMPPQQPPPPYPAPPIYGDVEGGRGAADQPVGPVEPQQAPSPPQQQYQRQPSFLREWFVEPFKTPAGERLIHTTRFRPGQARLLHSQPGMGGSRSCDLLTGSCVPCFIGVVAAVSSCYITDEWYAKSAGGQREQEAYPRPPLASGYPVQPGMQQAEQDTKKRSTMMMVLAWGLVVLGEHHAI